MTSMLAQFAQPFDFGWLQQQSIMNGAIGRLLFACAMGAAIGIQREFKHKAAGVRTNLLVSMGAAFFTLLSAVLAGDANPDKGRVASNIVQGIGFLGAGLILHNRNRVSGITSAASVFAVASIGMACGAGLYAAAAVATVIVIASLQLVGIVEKRANLKEIPLVYEARGQDQTLMLQSILDATDKAGQRLVNVERDSIGDLQRVSFFISATGKQHDQLKRTLEQEPGIDALHTFHDAEEE